MCLFPRLIRNKKYLPNQKNGWQQPPVNDYRVTFIPVGCGECIECYKQRQKQWQVRLSEDIKHNRNGKFITLTFDKKREDVQNIWENLKLDTDPYLKDNELCTRATRLFLERWRKKYKKSLRHWLITELGHGETEHVHMHGIIWTDEPVSEIAEKWKYGFIWPRYNWRDNFVNERTINYITKYVAKKDHQHQGYKQIILSSPGIGAGYMNRHDWKNNKYNGAHTDETYRTGSGHKIALPTYLRNKIYTDDQRELLWLQKLDKMERWVCGERVDISNGLDEYWKLLDFHRRRNYQLGYGNGIKDWNKETYERQQRELIHRKKG